MKQNQGPDYEFMDDDINNGTLGVDAGKDDMTKHHNEVMRKFKPKIVSKENVEFDDLEEAVANLFVKGDNPNQMALKIAKNAKGLGLKSAMMGNQVRVKGSQKQVNDFMRSVLGKSSMGSPTEKGASNPQIDKMLNKQLKEDVFRSNDFVGKIMEKVNDFGNEHELVETNLKVLQNIVKKKQNQKVKFKDKQATVDLFTASAIMKVYDAVKPDNKKKIEKLMNGTLVDFLKLQKFAMKQVKFAQDKMKKFKEYYNFPYADLTSKPMADLNASKKKKKKEKVDESRFMRGGIRLAFDKDPFGGKKMSIIMRDGVLDIPNSQHRNFLALMRGISEKDFK